jgi:elongation factor G
MADDISALRNIGISAHIDSGKTTLTERILFYCRKIHAMHEVDGKDGVGATMDSMDLERERGITIASASTNVSWKGYSVNVIDTPGHVDFTIEVERSLRVLDGAILVLCAVGGVQSQSITVDRQLKRYAVPRVAFVNKLDRVGADPFKVRDQLRERLGHNAVLMQIPIGLAEALEGVVDLVTMRACYFDGRNGETVREEDIPAHLKEQAASYREVMLDALGMFSDELAEAYLDGRETEAQIRAAARAGTLSLELTPVFMGSAYKNKGIQPLLDAVVAYLPSPPEVKNLAHDLDADGAQIELKADASMSLAALAFKLQDTQYGQLTYVRIYQGAIRKGSEIYNVRTRRSVKVGRLIRMHADEMEDIPSAPPGDIVALFGIDCVSGDTFTSGASLAMRSMFVPAPVISLAIKAKDSKHEERMAKALNRFTKEDPTFHSFVDPESKETIIRGMGELHLDVYIERMRREYQAEVTAGAPQVAYRETITRAAEYDYTHKKQTGGSGQYGRIAGRMEPLADKDYEFVDEVRGGSIPTEFIPACDKGFQECLRKGSLLGAPIVGVRMVVDDGASHAVDSSDLAFHQAAIGAFRDAYSRAKPEILEPIMRLTVEGPTEYQGNIFSSINQRRGLISASSEDATFCRIEADVPLAEMFGYSTALRSLTQGKAEYTMEFARYARVPSGIAERLKEEYRERKANDRR